MMGRVIEIGIPYTMLSAQNCEFCFEAQHLMFMFYEKSPNVTTHSKNGWA